MHVNLIPAGNWMDGLVDDFIVSCADYFYYDYFYHKVSPYSTDTKQSLKVLDTLLIRNIGEHWIYLQKCKLHGGIWEWSTFIGPEGGHQSEQVHATGTCMYCGNAMRNGVCVGCGNRAMLVGDMRDWGIAGTMALSICRAALISVGIYDVSDNGYGPSHHNVTIGI